MSGEKDKELAKKKAAAAAKAKAAALAKAKAAEQGGGESASSDNIAKQKAAAAAKAKAAALAKAKAAEQGGGESASSDDIAKQKAAAAAKAKAAALAKAKAAEQGGGDSSSTDDAAKQKAAAAAKAKAAALAKAKAKTASASDGNTDDREKAKAIAAAKAKAAAAAKAKAASSGGKAAQSEAEEEKQPSINQSYLDKYIKVIEEHLGQEVIEESYINSLSKDVPTLVINKEAYYKAAQFIKYNEQLQFDYLSELHGTDFETHMEVYVHLYSYVNRQSLAIKVKLDRDQPVIDSLAPLWAGANWPECEAYDLLGIKFTGHPRLYRIMLGDDWIGHPLRKDYEPYDVEV